MTQPGLTAPDERQRPESGRLRWMWQSQCGGVHLFGVDVFWGKGDGTLQPAQFLASGESALLLL